MKQQLLQGLLSNDGKASNTKLITMFGVVFGAGILAYATYYKADDLWLMYAIFMSTTCGLTVTKGIVDTKQKKDAE